MLPTVEIAICFVRIGNVEIYCIIVINYIVVHCIHPVVVCNGKKCCGSLFFVEMRQDLKCLFHLESIKPRKSRLFSHPSSSERVLCVVRSKQIEMFRLHGGRETAKIGKCTGDLSRVYLVETFLF